MPAEDPPQLAAERMVVGNRVGRTRQQLPRGRIEVSVLPSQLRQQPPNFCQPDVGGVARQRAALDTEDAPLGIDAQGLPALDGRRV